MPIDSSIYSQQQAPDILGSIEKGLTIRDLIDQRKMQQDALAKQRAMSAAYSKGLVQNPDGAAGYDSQKTLSALAQIPGAGKDAFEASNAFRAQKTADLEAQRKQHADSLDDIGRTLSSIGDQPSYEKAMSYLKSKGQDISDFPAQYDPKIVQSHILQGLSLKDQMDMQNKNREFDLKKQEIGTKHEENAIKREQMRGDKYNQSNQQTVQMLESMRGNPAVQKAENDLYAGQKANKLYDMFGDPNKMNPQMFNLYTAEIGKIANGGQATVEELKGLDPGTLPEKLSKVWQKLTNSPSPANLGEFAKQYKDYTDSIQGDAKNIIKDRYGRIIESKRRSLDPGDAKTLEQQYIHRFDNQGNQKPPILKGSEIEWAE